MKIFREVVLIWWWIVDPYRHSIYYYYMEIGLKEKYAFEKAYNYGR